MTNATEEYERVEKRVAEWLRVNERDAEEIKYVRLAGKLLEQPELVHDALLRLGDGADPCPSCGEQDAVVRELRADAKGGPVDYCHDTNCSVLSYTDHGCSLADDSLGDSVDVVCPGCGTRCREQEVFDASDEIEYACPNTGCPVELATARNSEQIAGQDGGRTRGGA